MSADQCPITPRIGKRPFGGRDTPGEPLTKRIRIERYVEESRQQQQAPPKTVQAEVQDPRNSPPLNLLHFSQIMTGLPPMTSKKGKERAQSPVAPDTVVDPHDLDAETLNYCFERDMQRYRAQIKAERVPVTPHRPISKLPIERPSFGSTQSLINHSSGKETKQSFRRRNTSRRDGEKKPNDVLSRSRRTINLKADIMAAIDQKARQNREHRVVCRGCDQCPIAITSEQHSSHVSDTEERHDNFKANKRGRLGSAIDLSILPGLSTRAIPDDERYQDNVVELSRRERSMSPPPEETPTKQQYGHDNVFMARLARHAAGRGNEGLEYHAVEGKRKRSASPSEEGCYEGNKKARTKSVEEDGLRQQLPRKIAPERQQTLEHPVSPGHPVTSLPHLPDFDHFTPKQSIKLYDLTITWYEHREQLAKLTLDRTKLQFELDNETATRKEL